MWSCVRRNVESDDKFPLLPMMAAKEAGLTLDEFLDLDAEECDRWKTFVLIGPSEFRTQLLLSQLIRMVAGFGGKPPPIEDVLPYYALLFPDAADDRRKAAAAAKMQARIEADQEAAERTMAAMMQEAMERDDG